MSCKSFRLLKKNRCKLNLIAQFSFQTTSVSLRYNSWANKTCCNSKCVILWWNYQCKSQFLKFLDMLFRMLSSGVQFMAKIESKGKYHCTCWKLIPILSSSTWKLTITDSSSMQNYTKIWQQERINDSPCTCTLFDREVIAE